MADMKILTVIPARGGSKGIPRKNIKPLAGKPLIAWSIESALRSKILDRVIVSTEDEEIAAVARACGAEVPFLRPVELAADTTPTIEVVLHMLNWMAGTDTGLPDLVLLLQATSPLRTTEDIEAAVKLQQEKGADAVASVCKADHPLSWMRQIGPAGELLPLLDEELVLRRQAGPISYQLNGALYLSTARSLLEEKTFLPKKTFAFVMPPERSMDIDTPWDFHLVDLFLRDQHDSANS